MLRQYLRVNILLPIKPEINKVFKGIVKKFCEDFGGITYIKPHISSQVEGIWIDDQTGKIIQDQHISLWIDVDLSNGIDVEKYFTTFKKTYEKLLNESVIWIMSHDAVRVA
jgi:hypothetical protein